MLRKSVRELGEFGLIDRIARITGARCGLEDAGKSRPWTDSIIVGIGDDAAVLRSPGELLVATTDMLVEGVHFRLDWMSPRELGYKSISVNVSDIAAMAGRPAFALVTIALDPDTPVELVEELYTGAEEACGEYGVSIIGGDTNKGEGLCVSVTLLGSVDENVLRRRSDASPGEVLIVTGSLGASAAGLLLLERPKLAQEISKSDSLIRKHKRPAARVEEALAASKAGARAMEDISDGLASELAHIAHRSDVGIRVYSEAIPIAPGVAETAELACRNPLDIALSGGEDYELVFSAPVDAVVNISTALTELGIEVSVIGETTVEKELVLVESGVEKPLGIGYEHF